MRGSANLRKFAQVVFFLPSCKVCQGNLYLGGSALEMQPQNCVTGKIGAKISPAAAISCSRQFGYKFYELQLICRKANQSCQC